MHRPTHESIFGRILHVSRQVIKSTFVVGLAGGVIGGYIVYKVYSRRRPKEDPPPPVVHEEEKDMLQYDLILVVVVLLLVSVSLAHPYAIILLSPGMFLFLRLLLYSHPFPPHRIPSNPLQPEKQLPSLGKLESDTFGPDHFPDHLQPFQYTHKCTFKHPWDLVVSTFWTQFPDPSQPLVKVELKSAISVQQNGHSVVTRQRQFILPNKAPFLLKSIMGSDSIEVDEKSMQIDDLRYLRVMASNISLRSIAHTVTMLEFYPHPENSQWTMLRQIGGVAVAGSIKAFKDRIKSFAESAFEREAKANSFRLESMLSLYN